MVMTPSESAASLQLECVDLGPWSRRRVGTREPRHGLLSGDLHLYGAGLAGVLRSSRGASGWCVGVIAAVVEPGEMSLGITMVALAVV